MTYASSTILDMLRWRRPAWSKSEHSWIKTHLLPLGLSADPYGNLYIRIGDAPVLWSCHTDTVHRTAGRQSLMLSGNLVRVADYNSNCLGADDTAGAFLMCEMIRAKRPGLYIFHRAEESGGQGSSYIAHTTPQLLDGIQIAIAFDRRGVDSVITHQGFGRCCSDTFAKSLSAALGLDYRPDSTGVFTDTANYVDLIPECTNISVGYEHEHTTRETLDLAHLFRLRDILLTLDTSKLTVKRVPGIPDYKPTKNWLDYYPEFDQEPRPRNTIKTLVQNHPKVVAQMLEDYGFSYGDLAEEVFRRTGIVYQLS